jgi:hypothetical protein
MWASCLAGVAYFIIVFAIGFVLGVVRTALLAVYPEVDRLTAVLVETPIILIASWFVCRSVVRRMKVSAHVLLRLTMGAVAFSLLLLAEAMLGLVFSGRPLVEHWTLYREPSYLAGLLGQILFALAPLVRALFILDAAIRED